MRSRYARQVFPGWGILVSTVGACAILAAPSIAGAEVFAAEGAIQPGPGAARALTPPPATGACEIGPGCLTTSQAICTGGGGTYLGDQILCSSTLALQEPGNGAAFGTAGDPVYLFSGEFTQSVVDLSIKGRGPDFSWGRKYRSRIGQSAGLGQGWDFSYNIRISLVDRRPGETRSHDFLADEQTFVWARPLDPGGSLAFLRYCTLRSTNPADFASPLTTVFIETDGSDTTTIDSDVPPPGGVFAYLVSAKNKHGEGSVGMHSDGTPRAALPCGAAGPDLILLDGTGRQDMYEARPGGIWSSPDHFQVFSRNPDQTFTLTFPDRATWSFRPSDGTPGQGKIDSLADRNGNALHFFYDAAGRLTTITDTLERPITIGWTEDGCLASVTDFTGRQVHYEFYDGIEPGGAVGDLEMVTTPAVTGTPTGNDFPFGKTTRYTYSTGFADNRLNHNLLTITDSKGQTYLTNEYDPATSPGSLGFDRLRRQVWGDPGDIIDFVYTPQAPGPGNGLAVLKAVMNDRVGNVSESLFDSRNRLTLRREYTGRADPDQPTDLDAGINPPVGPLRPDDPAFFETRYEWNPDSLAVRIVHPNLNEEQFVYDAANTGRRAQGNLLQTCRFPGPRGGDQAQICESFEYDTAINHDTNFPTRLVDGRGAETRHQYDLRGNRTRTTHRIPGVVEDFEYNASGQMTADILPDNGSGSRRRDEFTYYAAGPQRGYLHQEIIDAPNFALTTTFEYDSVGNVVRRIDPKGHDRLFVYNQIDQLVRSTSREVQNGSGVRYGEDTFYDANDNVVRSDTLNLDEQGVLQPNAVFSSLYEYDILDEMTRACWEAGSSNLPPWVLDCSAIPPADLGQFVVTEYQYDPNRQQTLVRYGEATNANQPANVVRTLFDERRLVYRRTLGEGDPQQSTTQLDYDGNQNRKRAAAGLEGGPKVALYDHDGYDRLVLRTDPMGNETRYHYDPNGNLVSSLAEGELLDVTGGAGNVRMSEGVWVYDPMDRLTRVEAGFFDPATQTPYPGAQQLGKAITAAEYSDSSQIVRILDDALQDMRTTYDTANRAGTETDALGNRVTYGYDANSNVTTVSELEKSDLGSPDATYVTTHGYDNLDRPILRTDAVGNAWQFRYDSRHDLTLVTDALSRQRRHSFDGLLRPVRSVRDMNGNGANDADPADIVTSRQWDASSRLVSETDDNGRVTSHEYDPLDRRVRTAHADGTQHTWTYDVHDNRTALTDPNGTLSQRTFDLNDRLTGKTIFPAPGVSSDTTFELFQYDGRNRLVRAEDDDSVLAYAYDSMSNTRSETVLGGTTLSAWDAVGRRTSCTYPGGRTIAATYDALDRMKTVSDAGGTLATYFYRGPRRVERRDHRNGTRTSYAYDGILPNPAGDFGRRQVIRTLHTRIAGGSIIDDRSYLWDRVQNKTRRSDTRAGGPRLAHAYTYDAADRLVMASVTNAVPANVRSASYAFDGVENRLSVSGSPDPGLYFQDASSPEPADAQVNQYSGTPFDSRQYDKNGNLVAITPSGGGFMNVLYDYRNQMTDYFDGTIGQHHVYKYDALGRRIVKIVDLGGSNAETRYFRDGRHVVEEQDTGGATLASYVFGQKLDETLQMQSGSSQYFYHADDLLNVMALTDAAGSVVERYDYQEWGVPEFRDVSGNVVLPIRQSAVGSPFLFQGRRYDPETGWYCHRARYRDPRAGEWTTRDVLGTWGDPANLGDANAFVGNNPWTSTDPFGLAGDKKDPPPEPQTDAQKKLAEAQKAFDDANTAKIAADEAYAKAKPQQPNENAATRAARAATKAAAEAAAKTRDARKEDLGKAQEAADREELEALPGEIEKLIKEFDRDYNGLTKDGKAEADKESPVQGAQGARDAKKDPPKKNQSAKDVAENLEKYRRYRDRLKAGIAHLNDERHTENRANNPANKPVITGRDQEQKQNVPHWFPPVKQNVPHWFPPVKKDCKD